MPMGIFMRGCGIKAGLMVLAGIGLNQLGRSTKGGGRMIGRMGRGGRSGRMVWCMREGLNAGSNMGKAG